MEVEVRGEVPQKPAPAVTASSLLASESLFGCGGGSRAGFRGY